MPCYEYECARCGGRIEEIQKFSDPPLKTHNGCGGDLKKLLSAPAIQFKGTGWYITDYARAGKKDGKDGKKKDKDSGSETKAETKSSTETSAPSKSEESSSKPAKGTNTKK